MHRYIVATLFILFPFTALAQSIDRVSVYAGGGKSITTWHGQADMESLTLELGHARSPRTEYGVLFGVASLWQSRSWFGAQYHDGSEKVDAFNLGLLVRHHFTPGSRRGDFSVAAGTGPFYASKDVPAATSELNFATHLGAGFTLRPQSHRALTLEYRFTHISNGGIAMRNPGLNMHMLLVGVALHPMPARR